MAATERPEVIARFIGIRTVCETAGMSKSSILRRIAGKEFPAPVIRDGTTVRWDYAEIMQWRAEQFRKREERASEKLPQIATAGA